MEIAIVGLISISAGLIGYQLVNTLSHKAAGKAALILDPKEVPIRNIAAIDKASDKLNAIFISVPKPKLLKMYLFSFIALGITGFIVTKSVIGLIVGLGVAAILPQVLVKQLEAKHRNMFSAQLVDGLMIISSSLKAGLSLIQALEELVTEMPAPLSQEIGLLLRENRMGVSLDDAFIHLRKRMNLEELNLVVTAIMVARETGGDLTLTFAQLATTIREKNKLHGKVRALCVQAKLQGIIMGFLPIAFAFVVYNLNHHYFDEMLKQQTGQLLIGYAVVSEIVGLFLIKKFSQIEV